MNPPRVTGNRVIAQPIVEKHSKGGIHLHDRYEPDQVVFYIVAVGPGRLLKNGTYVPIELSPGDRVISTAYMGREFEHEGNKLKIIDADELLLVIPRTDSNPSLT